MSLVWLLEFDAFEGLALPPGAEAWRALQGSAHRAYVAAPDSPGPAWQRLELLLERPGASAGALVTHHYVVETEVAPEQEAEFNDWYAREHLPGLAGVPGTVHAARYRREGRPRYVACYRLTSPDVLGSEPWLAVRHTEWSSRVRPWFRHTRRLMFGAA